MIKARDLIKKELRIVTEHAGDFKDLSRACLREADGLIKELLIKKANRLIQNNNYMGYLLKARAEVGIYEFKPFDKYVELVIKLAKRLERVFLRGEKLKPVLSDNSVIINVKRDGDYLDDILITNIKADTSCFYNLRHLYTDLFLTQREERILKEYGNYTLRAVLGKNEHGVEIWDFEVIDFEPLEVESD